MSTLSVPVALIDDHALFRGVLADMINAVEGYHVVAEAGNGAEYIEVLRDKPQIAVAIVDLHMPVMDGYDTIAWIKQNTPGTRALALTFEHTEAAMERALKCGACGFLLKTVSKDEFKNALDQVATVEHYHHDGIEKHLDSGTTIANIEAMRKKLRRMLTEREVEFVRLSCDPADHTYDRIAEIMDVHRRTIDGFRESVFAKFGVKSRAGMVIHAYTWGVAK
ncbi:MAG TPA: response regulator transcription factor [Flavobacteriales bacterium]|nr:response regulator transcription factor [Flavobacteriales bacterium]